MDRIRMVLERLAKAGAKPGKTGAMRIYIPQKVLDKTGTENFIRMHMANEAVLYRLAQGGGAGREIGHKQSYACFISGVDQNTLKGVGPFSALSSHKYGLNASLSGWWELRYFDANLDVPAMQANVALVLGMVKAASEGRGEWKESRPAATHYDKEVSRKEWNRLMHEVVGSGALKRQLEAQFVASGGKLEREILSPEARQALARLMASGCRIEKPKGESIGSLDELVELLDKEKPVVVVLPGVGKIELAPHKVEWFVLGENGRTGELPADLQARLEVAARGPSLGISYADSTGVGLSPFQAALLADEPGRVVARKGGEALTLGKPNGGITLDELIALEGGKPQTDPNPLPEFFLQVPFLTGNGYTFHDGKGKEAIQWPAKAASVFRMGDLVLKKGKKVVPVPNMAALEEGVLFPEKLAPLGSDERRILELAEGLAKQGYQFFIEGHPPPTARSAFLDTVLHGWGKLRVLLPEAKIPRKLPAAGVMRRFVAAETGHGELLDEETRRAILMADELRSKGYHFYDGAAKNAIRAKIGVPQALEDGELVVTPPKLPVRLPLSRRAFETLALVERGELDRADADLRGCLEHVDLLKRMGCSFRTVREGQQVEPTVAEFLSALEGNCVVELITPADVKTPVTDLASFLRTAGSYVEQMMRALPPEDRAAMDQLSRLFREGRVEAYRVASPVGVRLEHAEQVPWVFHDHHRIQVIAPGEVQTFTEPATLSTRGTPVSDWAGLRRFVANETRPVGELADRDRIILEMVEQLHGKGVQFHYNFPLIRESGEVVEGSKNAPIPLRTPLVDRLTGDGVKARLPRWTFWKGFPRKTIRIRGEEALAKLHRKLH